MRTGTKQQVHMRSTRSSAGRELRIRTKLVSTSIIGADVPTSFLSAPTPAQTLMRLRYAAVVVALRRAPGLAR